MLFGSAPMIGLDIGAGMVKAVTLRQRGSKVVVDRAGLMAMTGGAITGRKILDPPAAGDCVRKLCRDLGLRGRAVAVAVSGEEVVHARLKLEKTALEQPEPPVRRELAKAAPFPPEELVVDYQVLDSTADSQWVDVMAVGARRGAVERMEQVVARAGKSAAIVDSTACALANAFEANYQPASNEVSALLHLGAATLTLCLLRGGTPLLVRDLTLESATPWREQPAPAERVVVELERLLEQMDEIADDHPLEPRSKQIARLFLSGGGIQLRGLEDLLRSRVRAPFQELNPFRRIEFTGTDALGRLVWDHAHCMPVAVGLALRGFEST
jgi:type IV pilus assembly protein PilM